MAIVQCKEQGVSAEDVEKEKVKLKDFISEKKAAGIVGSNFSIVYY